MIKGEIRCSCGQLFGFETIRDEVKCPRCGKAYVAAEHGEPWEPESLEERGDPEEGEPEEGE